MNKKLSASTLRIILIIVLLLILAGGIAGFLFARSILVAQAVEVAKIGAQASTSQNKVENLQKALTELDANTAVENKVQDMVATGLKYTYQDQIVSALKTLGASAGVKVTNISFIDVKTIGGTATPAAGSSPAAPSVAPDIKLTQASVTVATPLRYDDLLKFIHSIEQNTMTMKVSKLSISKSGDTKANNQMLVNCDVLTIGVYTR